MPDKKNAFNIPPPELQLDFSAILIDTQKKMLQQALLETVSECDIKKIDIEIHELINKESISKLASRGVRAEIVYAIPTILRENPFLLGYYRLVLGFSRKAFYSKKFGLNYAIYINMENKGVLHEDADSNLVDLCKAINSSADILVKDLPPNHVSTRHIEQLSLLTFGTQLRGSHNVAIGVYAINDVFKVINEIVGNHAHEISENSIIVNDATGRRIRIQFSSDPDIAIDSLSGDGDTPLLAIEVKGGKDISNAHNRLGEAEKSHLKAKNKGYTDLWTIVNVEGLSIDARKNASPTTTAFFDLKELKTKGGDQYNFFKDRLQQILRLPAD